MNEHLLRPFPGISFIHFFSLSILGFSGALQELCRLGGQLHSPKFQLCWESPTSKVLPVLKPRGWHCPALHALLHPLPSFCPVELEYLSSLPWEIHSGALNTLQLGRNFPANFSLSVQPANPWMQPLLGPGILWPLVPSLNFHLLLQQGCSCTSGITHRFPAPTPPAAEVGAAHPALGYPNTPPAFQKMPLQGSAFSWLGSIPVHTQGIPPYSTGQPGKFPSWWQIPLKFPAGAAGPEPGALELETRSVVAAPVGKTRDLQALERMKEPLWSPEAAPCHPFNSVHTFPGREAKFLPRDWRHCARTAVTSATTQDLVVT